MISGAGGRYLNELCGLEIDACNRYFRKVFRRDPKPKEALFWTVPGFPGDKRRPLTNHQTHCLRIKKIGAAAREAGIIKRNIVFSPHLFRRSYATGLYKFGMKIKAIQKKTRNASIETLVKHYVYDDEPTTPYLDIMFA